VIIKVNIVQSAVIVWPLSMMYSNFLAKVA
jgi:hypothetical protein